MARNCAAIRKRCYFFVSRICFASLRATSEPVEKTSKSFQMAKSRSLVFLSFCHCCDHVFVGLEPPEAVIASRVVRPNRCMDEDTTQMGGGKGLQSVCASTHTEMSSKHGNYPTTQF